MSTEPALVTGAQRIFSGISVFNLIAIPFFIFAGNIMNKGGIAIKLINFAKIFTGRILWQAIFRGFSGDLHVW